MSKNKLLGEDPLDMGFRKSNKDNFTHGGVQKFKSRKKYSHEENEERKSRSGLSVPRNSKKGY